MAGYEDNFDELLVELLLSNGESKKGTRGGEKPAQRVALALRREFP